MVLTNSHSGSAVKLGPETHFHERRAVSNHGTLRGSCLHKEVRDHSLVLGHALFLLPVGLYSEVRQFRF